MDKKTNKQLKDYITFVANNNPHLKKVYLFGSYAKQTNNKHSDIDIALIIDNLDDDEKFDLQVELMLLASKYDTRIEPHPISLKDYNINTPFVDELKRTGVELKWK